MFLRSKRRRFSSEQLQRAVVISIATALLAFAPLGAQTTPPRRPADSAASRTRQRITMQSVMRSYRVGDATVRENAFPITYRLSSSTFGARISAIPLRFNTVDETISGTTPVTARVERYLRGGDTLRVYGQSASMPGELNDAQTSALAAAGTATLDLESLGLGTPALVGGRYAHGFLIGSMAASIRGGVETQPRPSGTEPVYWTGTTLKAAASLTGYPGSSQLSVSVDASTSFADSLSGRNLFPGGGTFSVSASGDGQLGEDSESFWQIYTFYFRPFADTRNAQPNRLIPVGDFMGVFSSLSVPVGNTLLWPTLDLMREASHTDSTGAVISNRTVGTGWAGNLGSTLSIPIAHRVDLTPGVGYVFGSVGATFTSTVNLARGPQLLSSDSFNDRIRGWWTSLELSIGF
jgi:hypothetical protein